MRQLQYGLRPTQFGVPAQRGTHRAHLRYMGGTQGHTQARINENSSCCCPLHNTPASPLLLPFGRFEAKFGRAAAVAKTARRAPEGDDYCGYSLSSMHGISPDLRHTGTPRPAVWR